MYRKQITNAALVFIGTLFIATIAIFCLIFVSQQTKEGIDSIIAYEATATASEAAVASANLLDLEMRNVEHFLKALGRTNEVQEGGSEECSLFLQAFTSSLELFIGNIGRTNPEGYFDCGVVESIIGLNGLEYSYLHDIFSDPEHQVVLSRGVMFQYTDHERYLAAMHVPRFDESGVFHGTLGGAIYFDELKEKLFEGMSVRENGELFLIDDNQDILFGTRNGYEGLKYSSEEFSDTHPEFAHFSKFLSGEEGKTANAIQVVINDSVYVFAYVPVEVLPERYWTVVVYASIEEETEMFAPLISGMSLVLTMVFGLILLFIFAVICSLLVFNSRLHQMVDERENQLKKAQSKLIKQKKMAALGEMASVFAHEIRNPLGVIKLAVYSLKKKVTEKSAVRHLNNIDQKIDESNKIIKDILVFSRGVVIHKTNTDLHKIISDAQEDVCATLGQKKSCITLDLASDLPEALADPTQIKEVIVNMLINAMQAVEKTKNKIVKIQTRVVESGVEIVISDSGEGIKKKEMKHLGKPFYSTKVRGVGLGLYISYKIIRLHGGTVSVESKEGKGTSFTISLPINNK